MIVNDKIIKIILKNNVNIRMQLCLRGQLSHNHMLIKPGFVVSLDLLGPEHDITWHVSSTEGCQVP